jgi:hypothetical protein
LGPYKGVLEIFHEDMPMDYDAIRELADARHQQHKGKRSSRPLAPNYELVGLVAEFAFGDAYGLDVDTTLRPTGDDGYDFDTPVGTIDIKASAKPPKWLPVEFMKVKADIYVQAHVDLPTETVTFLGWTDKETVKEHDVVDKFRYGILSHWVPKKALRPMEELEALLGA